MRNVFIYEYFRNFLFGCISFVILLGESCTTSKKKQEENSDSADSNTIQSEKIYKKIIRRRKVRNAGGFSQEAVFQDEQKYLDFLKGAVVSSDDWSAITKNGRLTPIYELEELEGAYLGEFVSLFSNEKSSLFLEMDINHARFLQKKSDRLPGANKGQPNSKFYSEEFFQKKKISLDELKSAAMQNSTDPVKFRISFVRFSPSKRMFNSILAGQKINEMRIQEEDFLLTKGNPTTGFISAAMGVDCSVSPYFGVESSWESAREAGIPINMLSIYLQLDEVEYRKRIRDIIKDQLEKFGLSQNFGGEKTGENNYQIQSGRSGSNYYGSKQAYDFVPVRPIDPTIPSNSTFSQIELENRAVSLLFPYESESRKVLKVSASDSYPLLTKEDSLESNFCSVVLTVFVLGKTIEPDGAEVLHIRYAPTAMRSFPKDWRVVDAAGVLMRLDYKDSIDVTKSMIMSTRKLMAGVFFSFNGKEEKELTPNEIRDQVLGIKNLAAMLGRKPPDDIGESAYEQILFRALSDTFLFLGKYSGAKTVSLRKVN